MTDTEVVELAFNQFVVVKIALIRMWGYEEAWVEYTFDRTRFDNIEYSCDVTWFNTEANSNWIYVIM